MRAAGYDSPPQFFLPDVCTRVHRITDWRGPTYSSEMFAKGIERRRANMPLITAPLAVITVIASYSRRVAHLACSSRRIPPTSRRERFRQKRFRFSPPGAPPDAVRFLA
jgi:hypothetical protein